MKTKDNEIIAFEVTPIYSDNENYSGIGTFTISTPGKYLFANGKIILLEAFEKQNASKETNQITKAEAIAKYGENAVFEYSNGDWEWEDMEGLYHLMRDDVELTKGLKAKCVYSYGNGDWRWQDMEGLYHLMRDDVELTKGLKAKWVDSYDNGDWKWKDMEDNWHEGKGDRTC